MKKQSKSFKPINEDAALRLFGRRLKEVRKNVKISQLDLAVEKDINLRRLSAWETGSDIKLSSVVKLCNALGITLKDFFSEGFD